METWKLREAYYSDVGRPEDKPTEDKIARRMLKAVGYSNAEKGLANYEAEFRGGVSDDMPLWPRTRQLLYDMLGRAGVSSSNQLDIQALVVKNGKELATRIELAASGSKRPAYIVLEDNAAFVYTICERGMLSSQTVPFQALDGPSGFVVIKQTAQTFARAYLGVGGDRGDR